jgi:hypothetical protein
MENNRRGVVLISNDLTRVVSFMAEPSEERQLYDALRSECH